MVRVRAGITGIIRAGAVYRQGIRHRCAVPVPRYSFVDGLERGIAHSAMARVKGGSALLRCYAVGRGGGSRVRAGVTGIINFGEGHREKPTSVIGGKTA